MDNNSSANQHYTDSSVIAAAYKRYEKGAKRTLFQIYLHGVYVYSLTPFMVLLPIVGILCCVFSTYWYAYIAGAFVIGISIGIIKTVINIIKNRKRLSVGEQIERAEGCSDNLINELYKMYSLSSSKFTVIGDIVTIAMCHNFRGEPAETIKILSAINSMDFKAKPFGAHVYYSAYLEALVLLGDYNTAQQVYNDGLYYMQTYMNSPIYGAPVTRSLAIYEYSRCNYQVSIDLCTRAIELAKYKIKKKNLINMYRQVADMKYWIALNYACMNQKDTAVRILNEIKLGTAEPFTIKRADILLNNLASENIERI